jgi:hypothetical protein
MNEFKVAKANNVGTTPVAVYTTPAGMRTMVIGLSVTNVYGSTLGFDLYVEDVSAVKTYIAKNVRVVPGQSYELMSGNKMIVDATDKIMIVAADEAAVDCIVTIMEDITIVGEPL